MKPTPRLFVKETQPSNLTRHPRPRLITLHKKRLPEKEDALIRYDFHSMQICGKPKGKSPHRKQQQ
jgi:hypothetical protein